MRRINFLILFGLLSPCIISGQISESISAYQSKLRVAENDSIKVTLYVDIAFEYFSIDLDSSIYYANKAMTLAKKTGSSTLLADAYSVNGTVNRYLGNFENSIENYEKSMELRIQLKDSVALFKILGNIGNAWLYLKEDYKKALEYYYRSLDIQKKLKLKKEIAITYINISSVYINQNRYLDALECLKNAEKIANEFNDKNTLGQTYLNMGEIYAEIEQHEKANSYFKKSLVFKRQMGDSMGVANTLNNLAALHEETGNLELSLKYCLQNNSIRQFMNDSVNLSNSLSNSALIYLRLKKPEKAFMYANDALNISDRIGYLPGLATASRVLGETYLMKNNYDKAINYCRQSYDFWKSEQNFTESLNSCICLYQSYEKKGDFSSAYKFYLEYNSLEDSLMKASKISETVRMEAKYEFEKKEYEDSLKRANLKEREDLERINEEKVTSQKIYLQQWIILISIILFVLIILTVTFIYYSKREKQKSEYKQKLTETELMALRAQMNPHFIFNCLSSIQNSIDKNDFTSADKYLGKFSKLLRTSLNTSRKAFISLDDEIEYLTLYLELEAMRMNQSFSFLFEVSSDILPSETEIPVMIIQPFLENSIKHGLAAKSEMGEIRIIIEKYNDTLKIKIRDNGIGRGQASRFDKNLMKKENHESLGLNITTNRLQLLYPEINNPIIINDLFNENGISSGTEVIITLKIND